MRIESNNSLQTSPQIDLKKYSKHSETRIGYTVTKNAFPNTDLKSLLPLRLVCRAWRIGFDSYVEKPWKKLDMLEIIQGNNCFNQMILHELDINQKTWNTLSSIQKVFFMSFTMQPLSTSTKQTLSRLYGAHRAELIYIKRVLNETSALTQVNEDFLSRSFKGPFEVSQFYKDRLATSVQPFLKLHLLRRSFKALEYPFSNFSNFLFIGKNSPNERSEIFFLSLLEVLKKYLNNPFEPKDKALFDSLDTEISKVLRTCSTITELKRALHLYPLNPKTLTLLSIIAYLECKKNLSQDITASINQPENHTMVLRSYFAALLLFTKIDNCQVQVEYLLNQIRQFPMATINEIQTPLPLISILISKYVPVEDVTIFLRAGLGPNPTGQTLSPLCISLSLEKYDILLSHHACPNHRSPDGVTAFQSRLEKGTAPVVLVKFLNYGADFSLIPEEVIYKNIIALCQRTLDDEAQRTNLVTIFQSLFTQIPTISESYPELLFLMLLIDSSYVWNSAHTRRVGISQFDTVIRNHKKHLNDTNAEKFGRVLFGCKVRVSELVSSIYDPVKALNPEIRCAILKGYVKAKAAKHPESNIELKLKKKDLEQILSRYYDQNLLSLLLDRIFSKPDELRTHILTLAKNRQTAITAEALQSLAVRGVDFGSIPILSKIPSDARSESVLEFLHTRQNESDDEKENYDSSAKRRKLDSKDA